MGSGKSTVGKLLAKMLSYKFIDTDAEIEKLLGTSINAIFVEFGEKHFRDIETKYISELMTLEKTVIATGGGMPVFNNNMGALNKLGTTVFLKTGIKKISKRLESDTNRPLISNKTNAERIAFIVSKLQERNHYYHLSKLTVMGGRKANEVANTIIHKLLITSK